MQQIWSALIAFVVPVNLLRDDDSTNLVVAVVANLYGNKDDVMVAANVGLYLYLDCVVDDGGGGVAYRDVKTFDGDRESVWCWRRAKQKYAVGPQDLLYDAYS